MNTLINTKINTLIDAKIPIIGALLNYFTYYVDAVNGADINDGKAPSRAWKTVAKANAATINSGESVGFRRGGTWSEMLIAKSGVKYGAYSIGEMPIFDVTGLSLMACVYVNNVNGVEINDFSLKGGTEGSCSIHGTSGSDGYSVLIKRVHVLENLEGDGFDVKGSAQALFYNITANDCHRGTEIDYSDQGLTLHDSSKAKVYSAIFTNCNYGITNIGTSECEIYDMTVSGSYRLAIKADGAAVINIYDSNIIIDRATCQLGGVVYTSTATLNVYDSEITVTNCNAVNFSCGGSLKYSNCIINVSSSMQYRLATNNAKFTIEKSTVNINVALSTSGLVAKTTGTGIAVNLDKTMFNGTGEGKNAIVLYAGGLSGGDASEKNATYCIFKNLINKPITLPTNGNANIYNNIFYNDVVEGQSVSIADTTCVGNIRNNIFYNSQFSLGTLNNMIVSNNDYYQSANKGGDGSITSNPLFISVGTDFRLQSISPCINAGVDVGLTEDIEDNPIVGIPDIGAYEYQS